MSTQYEDGTLTDETRIVRDGFLALQDWNGQNVVRNEYTWGLNLGGVHYSCFYDGKGNVEAVLDWERNVAAAYRYDPFGKLLAKTGALEQPFQFSTKRIDALTGLISYGYRFYSTDMDRWTTRDPLGEAGGLNLYAFVVNDPVNWGDPNGEEPVSLAAGAGFSAAGAVLGFVGGVLIYEKFLKPLIFNDNRGIHVCDLEPLPMARQPKGERKWGRRGGDDWLWEFSPAELWKIEETSPDPKVRQRAKKLGK